LGDDVPGLSDTERLFLDAARHIDGGFTTGSKVCRQVLRLLLNARHDFSKNQVKNTIQRLVEKQIIRRTKSGRFIRMRGYEVADDSPRKVTVTNPRILSRWQ
jgi:hypothetical protein